jgi:hypothetical protein
MFSFHEQKMYELKEKDRMEETKEARIDAIVEDLYQTKLNNLNGGSLNNNGWNMWDALNGLDVDILSPLGALIRDNEQFKAGKLLIKLVTNQLREDARNEAEGSK